MPGASAIHLAAVSGDVRSIKALLDKGVAVDTRSKNKDRITPLFVASFYGRIDAMRTLLDAGASTSLTMGGGFGGYTALTGAVINDQLDAVTFLVSKGVDIRATRKGITVVHEAARTNAARSLRFFLDQGLSATAKDNDGHTPLIFASGGNRPKTIDVLMDAGARVSTRGPRGMVAMHQAAHNGAVNAMEALLRHNSRIDPKDNNGETPLFYAAKEGKVDAIRWLARKGANVHHRSSNGATPMDAARASGHPSAPAALREFGAQ